MTPLVDILVAEDSPLEAELILASLVGAALSDRIQLVADGEEALDFLFCRHAYGYRTFEDAPKLVILDVKLPKVNGLEVVQQLKRDPRTRVIPVVMLTSSNVEQDVARGYWWGANSYVQKPVDFERFRETVQRIGAYWLQINEPVPARAFRWRG